MANPNFKTSSNKLQTYYCEICGAPFDRYPCQMKSSGHVYCSRKCVGESKKHGSEVFCHMCDTPFYRRFGEQDLGSTINQFCSKTCYHEWRAINRKSSTYIKVDGRHIHRTIAEQYLGRSLTQDEVIHHIDLNKHNNEPSNLAVLPDQAMHAYIHFGKANDEFVQRFSLIKIANSSN